MNKKLQKRRAHRKFVRGQKQLIRRRARKKRPRKWFYITINFAELSCANKIMEYAKEHKMSVQQVIRKSLKEWMKRDAERNGIQG